MADCPFCNEGPIDPAKGAEARVHDAWDVLPDGLRCHPGLKTLIHAIRSWMVASSTERDALRAELDAARADARWYCLNFQGLATLCTDKEEAEALAAQCDMTFPRGRPHRAALLGNVAAIDTAMKGKA